MQLNVILAVFNMLPIPPLDGSWILPHFLPQGLAQAYEQIRPYGFLHSAGLHVARCVSGGLAAVLGVVHYMMRYELRPNDFGLIQKTGRNSSRMSSKRVLSGMRPTGKLHLGHVVGALNNWVKLQNEYECFHFIADWHALTSDYADTSRIRENRIEMMVDWLAAGLDPRSRSCLCSPPFRNMPSCTCCCP